MRTGGRRLLLSEKKLFIFDLDGTLVDSYLAIQKSLNATREKLGLKEVELKRVIKAVGKGDRKFIQEFFPPQLEEKALKLYRKQHKVDLAKYVKPMPYARELLKALEKKKIKIAIASNRPTRFTHLILKKFDFKKYIDYVLCGDRLQKLKPAPDIVFRILEKYKIDPSEAVFVGDMVIDIETAKNASIDSVAITTGSSSEKELKKSHPTYLFKNLRQLKDSI
jgi:phosphoglycolate phosphatase